MGTSRAGGWSMSVKDNAQRLVAALDDPRVRRFRGLSRAVAGLVFVTAMSGAPRCRPGRRPRLLGVPLHGRRLCAAERGATRRAVPSIEREQPRRGQHDVQPSDGAAHPPVLGHHHPLLRPRARLEEPAAVLVAPALKDTAAAHGPAHGSAGVLAAVTQASLGISTLIYLVPIELASLHQAGSVVLLSAMCALLASLRPPSRLALFRTPGPSSDRHLRPLETQRLSQGPLRGSIAEAVVPFPSLNVPPYYVIASTTHPSSVL
ncbi:hypothetical protein L7F22_040461 [Adiantum nelumboides]|nr:hypothetical protein [Adiantum nelumboides]